MQENIPSRLIFPNVDRRSMSVGGAREAEAMFLTLLHLICRSCNDFWP